MSVLGTYKDEPHKITHEGREISLTFTKTSSTTGRLSWTLPKGAPGLTLDSLAYNGIVIVGSATEFDLPEHGPVDGIRYIGDSTLNTSLHAGSKINANFLVVAALYDNKTTTFVDVTGLTPNVPYYFAAFAVDNVLKYSKEGVYSYPLKAKLPAIAADTSGYQEVTLGIQPGDSTGGNITNVTHSFKIKIDKSPDYTITVSDAAIPTYSALVTELNRLFALLNSPFQGTTPPNANALYYDSVNKKLYIWDGTQYIEQTPIFFGSDPRTPSLNTYWIDVDDHLIYQRTAGPAWTLRSHLDFYKDPITPDCDDYWWDGTKAWKWDGTVWVEQLRTFNQSTDPSLAPTLDCHTVWYNPTTGVFKRWEDITGTCNSGPLSEGHWITVQALLFPTDPHLTASNDYWFDTANNLLKQRNGGNNGWNTLTVTISETQPANPATNSYWYKSSTRELKQYDGSAFVTLTVKVWHKDPATPDSGDYWYDTNDDDMYVWDELTNTYVAVADFINSTVDPSLAPTLVKGDVWWNSSTSIMKYWDGMQWVTARFVVWPTNPMTTIVNGNIWHDTTNNIWYERSGGVWVALTNTAIFYNTDPTTLPTGTYWINGATISIWNGSAWVAVLYSSTSVVPATGTLWYNTSNATLMTWNGSAWVTKTPMASAALDAKGNLIVTSGTTGCDSLIEMTDVDLFSSLTPKGSIQVPYEGSSGVDGTPMTQQVGVGTNANPAQRRELVQNILVQLGWPTIQVELTKEQLDFCVDQGLAYLRRNSSNAYNRVFFFLQTIPNVQNYILANECVGFNKVVDVQAISRVGSAFLGNAEGNASYGQIVLQHLYSMGTFDLVSYHIMSDYIELMEIMFAGRIMYTWRETDRVLSIHQRLHRYEKLLVDASIERTEQDLLQDRWVRNWIQQWATAEACKILAETRGKYQTLPGAGGGVALNSSDLRQRAKDTFEQCLKELDDYVVNNAEDWGMGTQFLIG